MKIRLARIILMLGIVLTGLSQAQAQSRENPTWINAYFGHQEYDGDLGSELFEFNAGADWAGGIGVTQYIHRYLDVELSLIYGKLDYKNFTIPDSPLISRLTFEKNFLNINALLKFKPLRNPKPVQPFVGIGFGATPVWGSTARITSITPRELTEVPANSKVAFQIPLQVGADVRITNNVHATVNATYNRTFSDGIDGRGGEFDFDGRDHDDFIVYSAGFKISLNKSGDSDGDGINDDDDLCPDKYGTSFWGCPDTDGDRVLDNEDACPNTAGSAVLDGCPDSDRDGVADRSDECPDAVGNFENNGCPADSDNDGVPDNEDACPTTAGNGSNNGCPEDADQDGVVDTADKCPKRAGIKSNNGCPEKKGLDENMKKNLKNIAGSLQFEENSSKIASSSHDELGRLAKIMQDDSKLRLIIRGHTDNTGNSNDNLELSVNRAKAVKGYLVQQGIQANRIAAFGYGGTRPIASNDTKEGRIKNRRVELNLYYQE